MILLLLLVLLRSSLGQDFPQTLSETKLFSDLKRLSPSPALLPYEINVAFWSDGAAKRRWLVLPADGKIEYRPHDQWHLPEGTLVVKHFDREGVPLETRLLRVGRTNITGASYRWRKDGAEADLLRTRLIDAERDWFYPSPEDCRTCHSQNAGLVLGLNTRQMNIRTQLAAWNAAGRFDRPLSEAELGDAERLSTHTEEHALRAYLDVNCALCHRPGGTPSYFDARAASPLEALVNAPVLFNEGIDAARVIAPRDRWRSVLLLRLEATDGLKMPPLARQRVDTNAIALFTEWIGSLPGRDVTEPPQFSPAGGTSTKPVQVSISHPDPHAIVRYTTDGSPPGKNSAIYKGPIPIGQPTTLRARAYRENQTRSVARQETYIIRAD